MLARTQHCLLAATRRLHGMSSFGLFMKQEAKNFPFSSFKGKTHSARLAARGKAMAKAYKSLPKTQMARLKAAAAKKKTLPRQKKLKNMTLEERRERRANLAPRKKTAYNLFVKKNYKTVAKLSPKQRLKKLGQMWKKSKN